MNDFHQTNTVESQYLVSLKLWVFEKLWTGFFAEMHFFEEAISSVATLIYNAIQLKLQHKLNESIINVYTQNMNKLINKNVR